MNLLKVPVYDVIGGTSLQVIIKSSINYCNIKLESVMIIT